MMICEHCDDTIHKPETGEYCSVCNEGPFHEDCLVQHLAEQHDVDAQGK